MSKTDIRQMTFENFNRWFARKSGQTVPENLALLQKPRHYQEKPFANSPKAKASRQKRRASRQD
jgi:hypothetical protein